MIVLSTLREQRANAVAVTAATREPLPWVRIVALILVAGAISFFVGSLATTLLGLSWNTQGSSVGVSACSSIVSGGVYYSTTEHRVGAFQGCDF